MLSTQGDSATTMRSARNATIQDVADAAGVSRAAVSKVIRNAYGVSPQMRARVDAAITRLNYRPRVAARAMRGRTNTIGIELPQISNEFLTMVVQGALQALEGSPFQIVVAPIAQADHAVDAIQALADRQVDGIITISPMVGQRWLEDLAVHTPLVVVGRHDVSERYDTVAGDDLTGATSAMSHLLDLGHRDIVFLRPVSAEPDDATAARAMWTGRDGEPHTIRLEVYAAMMRERGLEPRIVITGSDELDAAHATAKLLADHRPPTAVFAGNDTLAVGVLRTLAEQGLSAREVSVVGYDDITLASHPMLALTSVDQSGSDVGRQAVRLIRERLDGRTEAVQVIEEVELKVRGSTAPAPGHRPAE